MISDMMSDMRSDMTSDMKSNMTSDMSLANLDWLKIAWIQTDICHDTIHNI